MSIYAQKWNIYINIFFFLGGGGGGGGLGLGLGGGGCCQIFLGYAQFLFFFWGGGRGLTVDAGSKPTQQDSRKSKSTRGVQVGFKLLYT